MGADAFSALLTPLLPAPSTGPGTQQALNKDLLNELKGVISSLVEAWGPILISETSLQC